MAELAKKLHLKKGATEHTAKAYSTTAEIGGDYINAKIDGVTAYIAIGETTDNRATMGRVKKNGATKAILNSAKPVYTEQSYTTAGTFTFTVPKNVTRIRYAIAGAGSGAMGRGQYNANVSAGGGSSIDSISVGGGGSGNLDYGDDIGHGEIGGTQQAGGSPNGKKGSVAMQEIGYTMGTEIAGGVGWALNFNTESGTYGKGGNGRTWSWGTSSYRGRLIGGASGGYKTGYLDVTPNQTLSINVGGGSSGYWRGDGGNANVDWGANGFVLIAWGGYI